MTRLKPFLQHLTLWILLALMVGFVWMERTATAKMASLRFDAPATFNYAPVTLAPGVPLTSEILTAHLEALGYRATSRAAQEGTYEARGPMVIWPRGAMRPVRVRFDDGAISAVEDPVTGKRLPAVQLDALVLGRFYPLDDEVREPIRLEQLPPALMQALLVAEDRRFFRHFGVDFVGMGRALIANLGAGRIVAGGSTLTQQLAKTWFVGAERTYDRKVRELIYALILELRFSKREILEAYINAVYLGQFGRYEIRGFGSAALFYFGRPVEELNVGESALLVGLLKGASFYNPWRHPARAIERRALVLAAMADSGALSEGESRGWKATELGVRTKPELPENVDLKRFVSQGLQARLSSRELRRPGLSVNTTLDPIAQSALSIAFAEVLGSNSPDDETRLEGAGVIIDYRSGALRALVAGVQARRNDFNRSVMARRPVGSLIKPLLYLGWFTQDPSRHPFTDVSDRPVTLTNPDGSRWRPKNYDGKSHGTVSAAEALAGSYNLAAVDVGLAIGLEALAETLRRSGLVRPVTLYPSAFLGAVSLSPVEVTEIFQTLANSGVRQPLFAVGSVSSGAEVLHVTPPRGRRQFDENAVLKTHYLMSRVTRDGTARRVAQNGLWPVAGKTGTTDDVRDYWFVAFDGVELAVLWVGFDDNRPMPTHRGNLALAVWLKWAERLGVVPLPLLSDPELIWLKPGGGQDPIPSCRFGEAYPQRPAHDQAAARCLQLLP